MLRMVRIPDKSDIVLARNSTSTVIVLSLLLLLFKVIRVS